MRLNAFLARAGVASRRKADELVTAGRVRVNGARGELNTVVGANDVVEVDGRRIERQPLTYVLLHKPAGVVTTARDPHGRPTVVDLVPGEPRVVPVGRLDADTTGALLLTNDGQLAHRLAHPRYGVPKVYEAEVEGSPSGEAVRALREGVELEDGLTSPAEVRLLRSSKPTSLLELTLHEGRKRQVKRMCEAVGHPVVRLHRSIYAGLGLDQLPPGGSRRLRPDEIEALRAAAGG
jgi:pseudouridine synthase